MKIIKHNHALLELVLDSGTVLIDPGMYQEQLPDFQNVIAVCLTHVHDDHSYLPHIKTSCHQARWPSSDSRLSR